MIMKFLTVLVIALSGCHASMIWQDQPENSMDQVKNAFWNYVSQATLTAEETLKMIRNSELGQEINDKILKSAAAINGNTLGIQSQATHLTEKLLAKIYQEVDQVKLHLEREMPSVQSQLKPFVEEIRADIEEQVEWLKKDVASKALKSTLVQGVEMLKAKLERCFMQIGPQNEQLKQKLDQDFLEYQMSMTQLAQSFPSQLAQGVQELQENLVPDSQELRELDPHAQDLKAQLLALWKSFDKTSSLESSESLESLTKS